MMMNNFTTSLIAVLFRSIFLFSGIISIAQVGVGTQDQKNAFDINGAISLRESELILTDGIYNANINLGASPYSVYKITGPNSIFGVSGLISLSGADGQMLILHNSTPAVMLITHENTFSSPENRILVAGEKDFYVREKDAAVTLQYSASQSRWILLNKLNNAETWYTNGFVGLRKNRSTTITITDPYIKNTSGISVNLINNHGLNDATKFKLIVEYIEARNGTFLFRVNNKSNNNVLAQYAFTINY